MKIWLPAIIILAAFFSCSKSTNSLENQGVITGINVSECVSAAECPNVCDGSLYFHFTGVADTSDVAIDNPTIFNLSKKNLKFPIRVSVSYQSTTRCGVTAIKVISYRIL